MKPEIVYIEPADYFPEHIRRKYRLGEFAEKKDLSPPEDETETKEGDDEPHKEHN